MTSLINYELYATLSYREALIIYADLERGA